MSCPSKRKCANLDDVLAVIIDLLRILDAYPLPVAYWKFKKSMRYNNKIAGVQLHCPIEGFV